MLGGDHVNQELELADEAIFFNPDAGLEKIPFYEAVNFLKKQKSVPPEVYYNLEPKFKWRAFTVSRLAECDFIERAKQSLIKHLEKGDYISEVWEEFQKIANDAGMKMSIGYFETVYRTNIQNAYNMGRLAQYKDNLPPAWQLLFINDERTSDTCKKLQQMTNGGKPIPNGDPFWQMVGLPPYHFNCRTTFRAVYEDELGVNGVELFQPKSPQPLKNGFGGDPLKTGSYYKLTPAMEKRAKKYGLTKAIETEKKKLLEDKREVFKSEKTISENVKKIEVIKETRENIEKLFDEATTPVSDIEFTRENYNKMFPKGIVETPLGKVKLGAHQFEKLDNRGREHLLGTIKETLEKPNIILKEIREEKESFLYVKSFRDGEKQRIVMSVVIEKDNKNISISTHERAKNNVLNKLKNADIVFINKNRHND
ncbi:MAG: phage minor head protein [Treponemataceae bacterium]